MPTWFPEELLRLFSTSQLVLACLQAISCYCLMSYLAKHARNWRPPCGLKASSLARLPHSVMGRQSGCTWPTCPRMGEDGIVILHLSYIVYYICYILYCKIHTFALYGGGSAKVKPKFLTPLAIDLSPYTNRVICSSPQSLPKSPMKHLDI